MKKVFYLVLTVVAAIALYFSIRTSSEPVEAFVLQRGVFMETLSAEGVVRAKNKITVYAPGTGNMDIKEIKLKAGDPVVKGQIVTTIDWDSSLKIKSPIDGIISKVFRSSAGPVNRGEPLFEVSSISDLEVVAEVLTPDAIRLSIKGEAIIQNWGGVGDQMAEISQISRAGEVKSSALGVEEERTEVKLNLKKTPDEIKNHLGDNYHVDVLFVISKADHVLALPLGALFKSSDKWAVYMVQDGRARLRTVAISKKNDRQALVTDGLTEGDQVILFPGDKIREGTRVRVH